MTSAHVLHVLVYGLIFAVLWRRRDREISYLRRIAGTDNLWHTRCGHCGRRLRDRPAVTDIQTADNGVETRTSYHMYGGCADHTQQNQEHTP